MRVGRFKKDGSLADDFALYIENADGDEDAYEAGATPFHRGFVLVLILDNKDRLAGAQTKPIVPSDKSVFRPSSRAECE
jgi:hypothetical protein